MRNIFLNKILIFTVFILGFCLINSNSVNALKIDDPCKDVEAIFARGSGGSVGDVKAEAVYFLNQLDKRVKPSGISYHPYELGSENYGGFMYPATSVDPWKNTGNLLGAVVSSGDEFAYGDSVKSGVGELKFYINQRHSKCQSSGTKYILGGYSQGAQVIGQALPGISKNIRDDIVFVGLFGDPKLYLPEGVGFNPPACRGNDFSPWRRTVANCDLDSGSLGARKPYLPDDMKQKTGLWCYALDTVCDLSAFPHTEGHGTYKDKGRGIDQAAREAVSRLKTRLASETPPPTPQPGEPTPPEPAYAALDTRHIVGEGTTGENTVFAVDVSETMKHELPGIEQFLRDTIPKIIAKGGKVSVVVYIGIRDNSGSVFDVTGIITPFRAKPQDVLDHLDGLLYTNGDYPPGSSLIALHTIFNVLDWDGGATKAVTLFSNNPIASPDVVGLTVDDIAKKSLEIDPVNIYPVVPEALKESYADLASKTSGQVVTYTDDIEEAANKAYDKITDRPVPFLTNAEYIAEAGQEINFDASASYVIDSEITKYDWDFDGDGTYETTTTTPVIKHAYNSDFAGYMQVRVSAHNGTIANTSAKITIGAIVPPTLPATPTGITHTIVSTTDNKSTVTVSWQANPEVEAWLVAINDMPLGLAEGSRTSLDITDIERTESVVISVAAVSGAASNLLIGSSSDTVIPMIAPPEPEPPVVSTCSQSNFLLRVLCKAIAIFKQYIGGTWFYFLPYKV